MLGLRGHSTNYPLITFEVSHIYDQNTLTLQTDGRTDNSSASSSGDLFVRRKRRSYSCHHFHLLTPWTYLTAILMFRWMIRKECDYKIQTSGTIKLMRKHVVHSPAHQNRLWSL